MAWGTEHEPDARRVYAYTRNADIVQVGFVPHPTIAMSGASPDGLIGDLGIIEIKCPRSKTHLNTLLGADIDPEYMAQMQWGLACTGRRWCDWISYDPRMPDHLQLVVRRVSRLDSMIADLEADAKAFLDEVHAKTVTLQKMQEAA
jgi:hypothetical protein